MASEHLYRQRAKQAREKAEAATEARRQSWLEIARAFERLANQPEREPVWRLERVTLKKKPR
jgi:hypothetical protein